MKHLSILGIMAALALVMMCVGCAGVGTFSELPPNPVAGAVTVPATAVPVIPLAASGEEPDIEDDDAEYEEDEDEEGEEEEGEEDDFPFDEVGRMEVSFNALYRESDHYRSDSDSQEILLAPEVGIVIHKNFQALVGIGLYWLRGEEKSRILNALTSPVVGGIWPGHYRVEERYLDFGVRLNLPLGEAETVVPFAELKFGLATHAEWNRAISKHDWAWTHAFAIGTRVFVCEDKKAALTIKLNIQKAHFGKVTIGTRTEDELLFGFSFFF